MLPDSDAFARYRELRLDEGASPSTVRGEMNKLLGIARWLGFAPVVKLPCSPQRLPESWDRQQLKRLFRESRTTSRFIWGIPGAIYWPALLGTAYDTGERIGALLAVQSSDIDWQSSCVRFRAEIRKGGYCDAHARLSRQTSAALRTLRGCIGQDQLFLHGCPSGLWKAYGRLLSDAGLPCDRRSKFHRLRRTHATFVHKAGGDATASLGHSDPATTWKYYIDPRQLVRRLPWHPWFGW